MNDAPQADKPADRPAPPPRRQLKDQKWFTVVAACFAGVMIGYGFSGFAPKTPDWTRDAAQHHSLYRGWTVVPLSPGPATLEAGLAKASEAVGARLSLAVTASAKTLTPKRVDVLGVGEARLAQVVFAAPGGEPVGLYAIERRSAADWAPTELVVETAMRSGLASATWSTAEADFLLIGGDEQNRIKALAETFRGALLREDR